MKRYKVTYTDSGEPQMWNCKAYDAGHAYEKFWDMIHEFGGPEGIHDVRVTRRKVEV